MYNIRNQAAASNGSAAVLVGASESGALLLLRYAPSEAGHWKNRRAFKNLVNQAALKLGYTPDRRCRQGYRKTKAGAA